AMCAPRMMSSRSHQFPPPRPLLLVNIGQLLTLRQSSEAPGPRRGKILSELGMLEDAAVLCLGVKIVSVGKTKDALCDSWLKKHRKRVIEIECAGQVRVPGCGVSHMHRV